MLRPTIEAHKHNRAAKIISNRLPRPPEWRSQRNATMAKRVVRPAMDECWRALHSECVFKPCAQRKFWIRVRVLDSRHVISCSHVPLVDLLSGRPSVSFPVNETLVNWTPATDRASAGTAGAAPGQDCHGAA